MANLNIYLSDKNLILKTKRYARQRKLSISKLIEQYLSALTQNPEVNFEKIIHELTGSLPHGSETKGKIDYIRHRAG